MPNGEETVNWFLSNKSFLTPSLALKFYYYITLGHNNTFGFFFLSFHCRASLQRMESKNKQV